MMEIIGKLKLNSILKRSSRGRYVNKPFYIREPAVEEYNTKLHFKLDFLYISSSV